jgi:hypothetical protein
MRVLVLVLVRMFMQWPLRQAAGSGWRFRVIGTIAYLIKSRRQNV